MELSKRITGLNGGGSDGWGLFYRARRMKAAGEPVVELTIGEHDIGTDPAILDALNRSAQGGHTGYAMVPGIADLRKMIAQRITARTGIPTDASNIIVTAGGQAALFAAHMAVLDPGDRALFIDPYYATYPGTIRGASGLPVSVPTLAQNDFKPRPQTIAAQAPGAKSLLINTPNNPTGTIYDRATLEGIAEVCVTHDMWLISDEVYDTQIWEGDHLSPRALPGMADRTLVIGSMSKSHAMTGSRLGWIVGPKTLTDRVLDLSTVTNYGVPGYIQDAALFALGMTGIEAQVAAPFKRRRDLVTRILAGQNTIRTIPAQGAMYMMLDIRATGLSGEAFADQLLDTHRIAVMPGESFGQSAAGHVRVALTVADDTLAQAVETLCAFAQELAHG